MKDTTKVTFTRQELTEFVHTVLSDYPVNLLYGPAYSMYNKIWDAYVRVNK